ncbi:DUF4351 domain-containing protein [Halomonas sp. NO4]|uniref:DUF4351 domain-containing protein n=1 Tax=Halomonas sp. NO4 TaxID=2484813 RepID=UPI0013D372CB|nr:DUF4351 domain-containing protein [Halomonas sp. NO4]
MYGRGYGKAQIIELFRLIDWMMRLPDALEREFLDEHYVFEEAQNMPYVTSAERFGIEKGRQEGRQEGEARLLAKQMSLKFGDLPAWAQDRIETASTEQLEAWAERILTADSLEALLDT